MKSIAKNLLRIKQSIPSNVTLVAVSKTKPIEDLQEAIMRVKEFLVKIKFKKWSKNMIFYPKTFNGI